MGSSPSWPTTHEWWPTHGELFLCRGRVHYKHVDVRRGRPWRVYYGNQYSRVRSHSRQWGQPNASGYRPTNALYFRWTTQIYSLATGHSRETLFWHLLRYCHCYPYRLSSTAMYMYMNVFVVPRSITGMPTGFLNISILLPDTQRHLVAVIKFGKQNMSLVYR